MWTLQFTEYGGPEVITLGEAPEPHAGSGEIRIKVRAASVNPYDWKVVSGMYAQGKPLQGTGYPGSDAAGVVDEVGEGVTGVAVGDEVFGRGAHTQAEYAVLDVWANKPASVDWAVAAAAGMGLASVGTDTRGSIRIPSAWCGTVGLKPTYGRVSRRGVVSLSWSMDHVGPITRSVEDAALMLQAIAGHDPQDGASAPVPVPDYTATLRDGIRGLKIGVCRGGYFENVQPAVGAAVADRAPREEAERHQQRKRQDAGGDQQPA